MGWVEKNESKCGVLHLERSNHMNQYKHKEELLYCQSDVVLAQAAQEGGGVTVSGGVQEMWICGTEGHGLVGMVGLD